MVEFGLAISGDRTATLRFATFPDVAHDRLLAAMQDIEQRLEAAVKGAEPTRSGALQGLTGGRVYDHGDRIAAVVGVRAPSAGEARKAAALEYGSTGKAMAVRAHQMSLDHIWSRAIAAISVAVPNYNRTPNIAARSFLRGPIEAMRDEALAELQAALTEAVTDASA
jgi:hypothetical protein